MYKSKQELAQRKPVLLKNTPKNDFYIEKILNTKAYLAIPHCLLEHIVKNKSLSASDKLTFLYAYSLSFFNYHNGKERNLAMSLENIAGKLNISKAQVFASQKHLEQLGLVSIKRQNNRQNQRKPNLITPCIPDNIFAELANESNRAGISSDLDKIEANLDYLERTKQFIPFNYAILKFIVENENLSPAGKILAIDLFTMCYKYHLSSDKESDFKFLVNYKQLIARHNCTSKTLSNNLIALELQGLIYRKQIFAKNGEEQNARHDKSIWEISFNFPQWYKDTQVTNNIDKINADKPYSDRVEDDALDTDYTPGEQLYENFDNSENSNSSSIIDGLISKLKDFKSRMISAGKNSDNITGNDANMEQNPQLEKSDLQENFQDGSKPDYIKVRNETDRGRSEIEPLNNIDIIIKTFNSNLRGKPKVIFNNFLNKIGLISSENKPENKQKENFSIPKELIRRKLRAIPKEKADKARKYAYALTSKKLTKGYAASLSKHELAKQLIFHISSWKPTKLGHLTREQEIDTALSVAWKAITDGSWQAPLEYAKSEVMNYEFINYRDKYLNDGVLSPELKTLEIETDKLFGGFSNLTSRIQKESRGEAELKQLAYDDVIATESVDESPALGYLAYSDGNEISDVSRDIDISCDPYQSDTNICHGEINAIQDSKMTQMEDIQNQQINHSYSENINDDQDSCNVRQIKNCTSRSVDLSHIPEQNRSLAITPSETDDSVRLQTSNGREYFVNLRELEVNESGEFVMTLQPSVKNTLLEMNYISDASPA